ncbi:MAG: M15 family metallopeptidase [Candidatus Saccharibacteria bacterium]|nr:M15 family metallopeptidase [Candidatus Saccharibacteria bacterium]
MKITINKKESGIYLLAILIWFGAIVLFNLINQDTEQLDKQTQISVKAEEQLIRYYDQAVLDIDDYPHIKDLMPLGFIDVLKKTSQLDPSFYNQKQQICGIAGWSCQDSDWQRLKTLASRYDLNYISLEAQFLYMNHQLENIEFNINLKLDNLPSAYRNFYYHLIETHIIIRPVPKPAVATIAPISTNNSSSHINRQPQILPTKQQGCWRQSNQYIKTVKQTDSQGYLLKPVEVLSRSEAGEMTTTYVHRCIHALALKLLKDYNSSQTNPQYKLGFSGWRSHYHQVQARLRPVNGCITVDAEHPLYTYQVYEAGSTEICTTPVARPGHSNHQDGLALDFYCLEGGSLTRTNCNKAYEWLRCHGAKYGLVEFIKEPWHWDYFTQVNNGQKRLVRNC